MNIEHLQFNAIILESKLELTMMLMSLKNGENIENRMIRLIETLEELPYKPRWGFFIRGKIVSNVEV